MHSVRTHRECRPQSLIEQEFYFTQEARFDLAFCVLTSSTFSNGTMRGSTGYSEHLFVRKCRENVEKLPFAAEKRSQGPFGSVSV